MTNVACVKVGTAYSAEYVNILFDCVRRNLPAGFPGRFVCFTDDATGLDPLITVREVPKDLASRGWWAKLYLFAPDAFPKGERVLYFDLDTVVCGPLDAIAAYQGPFAILRDAYRPGGLQSSVMAWEAGLHDDIYSSWVTAGKPDIDGGDQVWIEELAPLAEILQVQFPDRFKSYKVDARAAIPKGCSVVFFHGHPRPHEVTSGWVPEVWKIGGGSGVEWVVQANTASETLWNNARSAIGRKCKWLEVEPEIEGSVCIVGGGPSLAETLFYIRGMQMSGTAVWATGNSYKYLVEQGIKPDAHILLDARPENLAFVPEDDTPKYYASQCAPALLDKAGKALVGWHCAHSGYEDAFRHHPSADVQVGGGTTVGLKAVAVAYIMGYRNMRLFGFDSSYRDSHHAYPQPLNDNERVLDAKVGGKTFRAAPWMIAQAEEFKDTVCRLVEMGCMVTVYGDGLLPTIAEEMGKTIKMVDGLYWPEGDVETRSSVMATLDDLGAVVEMCPRRRVAVQAGGNVGVWPKELSKHFGQVVTFEPDPVNWDCLSRNVQEPNVKAYNAALGSEAGSVSIQHDTCNCGASRVTAGDDIPVMTIDSLELDGCDLLQLDVEGYELHALKGAKNTIDRYSPVIMLEQKGLESAYGVDEGETAAWLGKMGYVPEAYIHRDVIYTRVT